ncbi:PIG-L family deacetylase [Candidatus Endomicrobiellum trichonymphae]|nr:PIG-L family deacetylase [Candidatus Endomicrobium trichonymphae]
MVITSHQDDEAVVCAVTAIKHVKTGSYVEIAFLKKE